MLQDEEAKGLKSKRDKQAGWQARSPAGRSHAGRQSCIWVGRQLFMQAVMLWVDRQAVMNIGRQIGSHADRQSFIQAVMHMGRQAGSHASGKVGKGLKWRACNSTATVHRSVVKSEAVVDRLTGRQEKNLNMEKSSK